ncbi:MAG: glycosyltransferase family 1 protein, partial [Chloroflexi bacterium]|nr:glycosyltransferase family 1 protein [Chloroflexota bacterium]
MHIGINAHLMEFGQSFRNAGIGKYVAHLVRALGDVDQENRYTVFTGPLPPGGLDLPPNFTVRPSRLPTGRAPVRILWEQLVQPWLVRSAKLDVLHCPGFVAPLGGGAPVVLTIHDLSFFRFPERLPAGRRRYLQAFTRVSAGAARLILCDSHHTAHDVHEILGIPRERMRVVYPGVEPRFAPQPAHHVAEFRRRAGLPDRFLLYLGTLEPRKNLGVLLRAYARLRPDMPDLGLVLAGGRGWMVDSLFRELDELGLTGQVILPGYVPDDELPLWYSAATALVYPSVYEGFGLPPLEAMACGSPVVVAQTSSVPE